MRASTSDSELLWALRGGGGNFGVVTALEFQLHPVGPVVFGGLAAYDPAHGRAVAEAFRDFYTPGPDESGVVFGYIAAPPEDFIPEEWHGKKMAITAGMWNGPAEEGERALEPLRTAVEPIVDLYGEIPYAELQQMIDDPPGKRNWWTAEYLDELTDDALDALVSYSEQMPVSFTQMLVAPWGGQVARAADSPLAKRDARFVLHPFCVWEGADRDEEHITWGRACRDVFAEWANGGVYLNFVGDEGEERVRAAFGDAYERLAAVKERLDPGNVFRGNQNIRPRSQLVSLGGYDPLTAKPAEEEPPHARFRARKDPQRRRRRPPRHRQDLARRGAALPGWRREPAGHDRRRHDRRGLGRRRAAAAALDRALARPRSTGRAAS